MVKDKKSGTRILKRKDKLNRKTIDTLTGTKTARECHTLTHLSNKKEMTGKRLKQDQFIEAFVSNLFNVSKAAREVGIDRRTFYHWKSETGFLDRFTEAVETKKDFVEHALFQKVADGDVAATIFAAKCLLLDRGYKPDKLLKVDLTTQDNHLGLTKEQRDDIVNAASATDGFDYSQLKGSDFPGKH